MPGITEATVRGVLLHGPAVPVEELRHVLDAEGVVARSLSTGRAAHASAGESGGESGGDPPTVVIVDSSLSHTADALVRDLPGSVAVLAWGPEAEAAVDRERLFMALPDAATPDTLLRALQAAFRHAARSQAAGRVSAELDRTRAEVEELNQIGMALMTERDPDRLLVKILERSMSLTRSDAGSLYLVESDPEGGSVLRFKLSSNQSLPDLPFMEFTLPIDHSSIAGHVAATNKPLVLDDAYSPPDSAPFSINRSFDERFGYRTRSMLVVPMTDHKGVVVGVLQLINRKRTPDVAITSEAAASEHVLPFGDHELSLVRGLAGQAAVSIENARLYTQIETLFESFVKAAVTAIDQRDPTTAGHSVRVAALTTGLARRLPRLGRGRWAGTRLGDDQMKELRYAALLHDFGKVGVREEVLVKANKLPPHLWERVDSRFDLVHRTIERDFLARKLALMEQGAPRAELDDLDVELQEQLGRIQVFRAAIHKANEPSVLPEESASILLEIGEHTFQPVSGGSARFLEPEELAFLSIRKGSLNERERLEIESHVTQTYRFLTQIPWTADLSRVAEIAHGHHEKLDGRGYPRRIAGDEIPVQTRMMTIADIFDALTASDRPYKRAMSAERALDILGMEARDGMLDAELVELFIDSRVYAEILDRDWREL
jgi:HD-GYP domain-containing protein (c-di-GMP phosphodiesterase class II)